MGGHKMSDLARELRRIIDFEGVCATAADRIEALEAEVDLQKRHIMALQEAAVTRETWLKNTEAEVERLRALLRGLLAGGAKDDPYVKAALDGLLTSLEGGPAPQGSVEDIIQGIAGRNK
jgi:hypothetical protein